MSRSSKKAVHEPKGRSSDAAIPAGRSSSRAARDARRGDPATGPSTKRLIFRFVAVLITLLIIFNYLYYVAFVRGNWLDGYLELSARITGGLLRLFGENVTVEGASVSSLKFSMRVAPGCDAIQAVALYALAIVAFPVRVSWLARLVPLLLGCLVLVAVNFVRIGSLYYVGAYYSTDTFETVHIDVWQTIFIFLPIFLWLAWVWWAIPRAQRKRHADA